MGKCIFRAFHLKNMFTGHKDVDRLILESIESEKDFMSALTTSKNISKLYDENMFRKRIMHLMFLEKDNISYKQLYLKLFYYIKKLEKEYEFTFTFLDPITCYNILSSKLFYLWKIRRAIRLGYNDLAIFITEKRKTINNTAILSLFLLSARVGDKFLTDYYLKMGNFGKYEYNKAAKEAELSGHFELAKYLMNI